MAKKRIHLTEGQLYGLVEQAINELDWRTYASAMDKSIPRWREKGMDATIKRAAAFKNAAEKAFKQENGADIDIFPSVYAPSFRYKGVNNDLNLKFSRRKEPEGQWSGYPKDAEDEYGNTVEDPNIVKDWENMDKIAAFGNGWDVYNKKSGRWETRPTEMEWDDETGQYNWKPTDESFARKVTESVMRLLKESREDMNTLTRMVYDKLDGCFAFGGKGYNPRTQTLNLHTGTTGGATFNVKLPTFFDIDAVAIFNFGEKGELPSVEFAIKKMSPPQYARGVNKKQVVAELTNLYRRSEVSLLRALYRISKQNSNFPSLQELGLELPQ